MSGELHIDLETVIPDVLELPLKIEAPMHISSVALIRDEEGANSFSILPPEAVHTLVEQNIQVYMQHGFGSSAQYTDMEYANAGVIFEDDFRQLTTLCKILIKQRPFSQEQLEMLKEGQIIFTSLDMQKMKETEITLHLQKKVSAFGWNLIHGDRQEPLCDAIIAQQVSNLGISLSLSDLLLPILTDLIIHPKIRYALQKNPALMQCIYCYDGTVCHEPLAARFHLPWRDIISLCWELN